MYAIIPHERDCKGKMKELGHCGKVSRCQEKIDENFANYFLKTKTNNKCFIVLNVHENVYRKV